jgi:hypothetical protein
VPQLWKFGSINGASRMTAKRIVAADGSDLAECWCCGQRQQPEMTVHLGNHQEVRVCLRCAHFLHQQAGAREDDALHPSPTAWVRDRLRSVRTAVMQRRWHQKPVIGPALRWLGRHLP